MKQSKKEKSLESLDEKYLAAISTASEGELPDVREDSESSMSAVASADEESPALDLADKSAPSASEASAVDASGSGCEKNTQDTPVSCWEGKNLKIDSEKMLATLCIKGGPPISAAEIRTRLGEMNITHGVDEEALTAIEVQTKKGFWQEKTVVARGAQPEVRLRVIHDVLLSYSDFEKSEDDFRRILVDRSHRLKAMLAAKSRAQLNRSKFTVIAIKPGEVLFHIEENKEALSGSDIFGNQLPPKEESIPAVGGHVKAADQAGVFESSVYGYLYWTPQKICVYPPFWIESDKMSAYLIALPQYKQKSPEYSQLRQGLLMLGVKEPCFRKELMQIVCKKMAAGEPAPQQVIKVAEGILPHHGADAQFSLYLDTEQKAGKLREDGTLDLRERNSVVSVQKGMLLAEKILATKGRDGCNVLGKKIKARDGADIKVVLGAGVIQKSEGEKICYYAEKSGSLQFSGGTLAVEDVCHIPSDIDYGTGNIDVETNLVIDGSILSGFSVNAQGNVHICGSVEDGAFLYASGSITIDNGILGSKTKVICLGDLRVMFIQDAEVFVRGEAIIESYLFNSMLRANGAITVLQQQGAKSSRATGGVICSSAEIHLSSAGGPSHAGTLISIQPDPEFVQRTKQLKEQAQFCVENVSKITRSLPFDSFDGGALKQALARMDDSRRAAVVNLLTNLNKLIKQQKVYEAELAEAQEKIDLQLHKAKISIAKEIFAGCEIQIGERKFQVDADYGPSLFQLRDGHIVR